ncbi:MAG: T9SS type A sorting domain-containing protein [Caldisericaceae bacterium]|nr:T9SS type A sorting domain-containing protein [Caldisericaceae bacterium]
MRLRLLICILLPVLLFAQNDPISWKKNVVLDTLIGIKKIALANIDRDAGRNTDIAFTSNPENDGHEDPYKLNVGWLKNTGDQVFEYHAVDYLLAGARGLAIGDLNGDGWPEIVAGSRSDSTPLIIYRNDSTPDAGIWPRTALGGVAPNNYAILIQDLDADGQLDIIDGFGDDANYGEANRGTIVDSIRFLKNRSTLSQFSFQFELIAQAPSPSALTIADFDDDGLLDVADLSWIDYSTLTPQSGENFKWWAQQPDTTFLEIQEIIDSYGGNDLQTADLNGDGSLDLIAAGYKTGTLDLWPNDGTGLFNSRTIIDQNLNHPRHLSLGDIDSDGDQDIALTVDAEDKIIWYENQGSLNFTKHVLDSSFTFAYFVKIYDLDGDGDADLIGTAQDAGQLAWWENDLAEEKLAGAGNPDTLSFNENKLLIDYQAPFSGGLTSVHFNHGANKDSLKLAAGIEKVVAAGIYTIVSHASSYQANALFRYDSLPEWQSLVGIDESRLRICYWNDSTKTWQLFGDGGQVVDTLKKEITVLQINHEFHKYSKFTLALATGPSAIALSRKGNQSLQLQHVAFPNPFNSQVWIKFNVPENFSSTNQKVDLTVFNGAGQKVRTLLNGNLWPGQYRVVWDAKNDRQKSISSGWYFYQLKVGKLRTTGKILLIR